MSLTLLIRVHLNRSRCSQRRRFAPQTAAAQPTQRVPRTTKNDGLPHEQAKGLLHNLCRMVTRSKVSGIGLQAVPHGDAKLTVCYLV